MNDELNKKYNLNNISLVGVIAMILVLLGHAGCVYAGKWDYDLVYNNSETIKYITEYIYSFHMPLFIFISGYLYFYNKVVLGKYKVRRDFIKNKFHRLLIPYIITGVFFMIPVQMIFRVYKDNHSFLYKVINGILLTKQPAHLWFLLALFNIFLIFYCIEDNFKNRNIILNFLLLALINIISYKMPSIYGIRSSLQYLIYFYMGYIFCQYIDYIKYYAKNKKYLFVLHLLLFNIQYFLLNTMNINTIYFKVLVGVVGQMISIMGISYIFMYIYKLSGTDVMVNKITRSKTYNIINKNKFYIYLVHQPIMLSLLTIIKSSNIKPIIVVNLLFWVTLFISILLAMFFNKTKIIIVKIFESNI